MIQQKVVIVVLLQLLLLTLLLTGCVASDGITGSSALIGDDDKLKNFVENNTTPASPEGRNNLITGHAR